MAMALSEEEQYRSQVREKYKQELGKKRMPIWLKIGLLILGIFFFVRLVQLSFDLLNEQKISNSQPTLTSQSPSTPTQIQTPTSQTEEKTQVQQVVNVKELIGKRYADLNSILGTPHLISKPRGEMTGLMSWDKGDIDIETNYYNLHDLIQMMSFTFKKGVMFEDYNEAFKIIGLDAINSKPDKTTTFQKKWYNMQGVYEVIFTSGIDGRQAVSVLFYCNPDRLGICKFD